MRRVIQKSVDLILSGPFLALLVFLLYIRTLAPGVWGFDSAELATGVFTLGIVHPPGYPLYIILGKLFSFVMPVSDLAYRLNLMSAFFAALTIWILYLVIKALSGKRWAAWVGAGFFAISNYFWQMAIVAEVYTLHTFFLSLNIFILLRWNATRKWKYLYLFCFCFGLSLANHTTGLLFLPGFLWLIISSYPAIGKNWRNIFFSSLLFLLGLLPYIYLPIRALSNPELNYVDRYYGIDLTTLPGFFWMISGQAYRFFAFGYQYKEALGESINFLGFLWRNFFGIGVIFGIMGIILDWSKRWKIQISLLLIFLANAFFFINYRVLDKDTMFLPAFLIFSIWLGLGLFHLYRIFTNILRVLPYKKFIEKIMMAILMLAVLLGGFLNIRWLDMSSRYVEKGIVSEVLRTVPQNSTIFAKWSTAVILEYFQTVKGVRSDIMIINRSRMDVALYYKYWSQGLPSNEIMELIADENILMVSQEMKKGAVYIVEYDPMFLREYEYHPQGNYFQLSIIDQ